MRGYRTVIGVVALLGLSLAACNSPDRSSSTTTIPATSSTHSSTTVTSPSSSTTRPPDRWGNIFTIGPPSPDIPRFTVDGRHQTILDWYSKLKSGECQRLVHDTLAYSANRDNRRETYALAFLYRGAAYACLHRWHSAAIDLEAATICKDDLDSIGNSDHHQPFKLLAWAIRYVRTNGEHVGGGSSTASCGSEPTTTVAETTSTTVSSTTSTTSSSSTTPATSAPTSEMP